MKNYAIITLVLISSITCEKFDKIVAVKTGSASDLTPISANISGIILDAGNGITAYGHCWSKNNQIPSPNNCDGKTSLGNNKTVGGFISLVNNLEPGTTYYIAAYASSANEMVVGKTISFTTLPSVAPTVETIAVTDITQTSVTLNGIINANGTSTTATFDYGTSTSYGSSENASQNPITGMGNTPVSINITGLTANTLYHYRAKAVSTSGTSYGIDLTFTTSPQVPSLTTKAITEISQTIATSGGNITDNGGAEILARGVCWATMANPTIMDNVTINGLGMGTFISNISGLKGNTTYYLRAYATNSAGVGYCNELSFTTTSTTGTITDIDGNVYHSIMIGTQEWLQEDLKTSKYSDGTAITNITDNAEWTTAGAAYCWYNNDIINKPTYGALYNWYAVDPASNGNKNLCPKGWHVNTHGELESLITFLGGGDVAGGKMKEAGTIHWASPNTGADNSSGYTALPCGDRNNGNFINLGSYGSYWTSTEFDVNTGWQYGLGYDGTWIVNVNYTKQSGFGVRCLKGDPVYLRTQTTSIIGITPTSATASGNVVTDGSNPVTERGICFSTSPNPTLNDSKALATGTTGAFTCHLTGLTANTFYYVRAFATNSAGTTYGNEWRYPNGSWGILGSATPGGWEIDQNMNFNSTNNTWSITLNMTKGEIVFRQNDTWDVGYYGVNGNLILAFEAAPNIPINTAGNYTVTINLSTLKYTITLNPGLPLLTTSVISAITTNSAISGGNVTSDGGSVITERGICYNTSPNPNITNSKVTASGTLGNFTCDLTGLTNNITYYVRAYASNSAGTSYGNELICKTYTATMTDIDNNIYNTVTIGNQIWMVENLKVKHYSDGATLFNGASAGDLKDDNTSKYYFAPENNELNVPIYGLLYTKAAILKGIDQSETGPISIQGICPTGWHVPSDLEWKQLEIFIGLSQNQADSFGERGTNEGGKLKESGTSHWISPNTEANNAFSFNCLPAGARFVDGNYSNIRNDAYFWTCTYYRILHNNSGLIGRYGHYQGTGMSVRCVKD